MCVTLELYISLSKLAFRLCIPRQMLELVSFWRVVSLASFKMSKPSRLNDYWKCRIIFVRSGIGRHTMAGCNLGLCNNELGAERITLNWQILCAF